METEMKVHKRKGDAENGSPAKKAKKEEPEEEDDGDENKRTLFVRNLPFSVTEDQVRTALQQFNPRNRHVFIKYIFR